MIEPALFGFCLVVGIFAAVVGWRILAILRADAIERREVDRWWRERKDYLERNPPQDAANSDASR